MTILIAVLVLALGTYAFRATGPVLEGRVRLPVPVEGLLSDAAIVLLVALTATATLTQGQEFAGWARPAGVIIAAGLALLRVPFPIVVLAAAVVTAVLRLLGVE